LIGIDEKIIADQSQGVTKVLIVGKIILRLGGRIIENNTLDRTRTDSQAKRTRAVVGNLTVFYGNGEVEREILDETTVN